jgi:hypothetical protein
MLDKILYEVDSNDMHRLSGMMMMMMEAVRTSEKSVYNHFTRHYIPEDNSEHHTRHHENLKSHIKDSLYEEIGRVFNQFLRYDMKIFWIVSMQK